MFGLWLREKKMTCLLSEKLFGIPVQSSEIPTGVSGTVRLYRRHSLILQELLSLLQRRTLHFRNRFSHPGRRPPWTSTVNWQAVLNVAFLKHPERFKEGMPKPTGWPFPHLPGSTNRRFPKATCRYTKFLPEVSHFY